MERFKLKRRGKLYFFLSCWLNMLKTFSLRYFRLILNVSPGKGGHPTFEVLEVMLLFQVLFQLSFSFGHFWIQKRAGTQKCPLTTHWLQWLQSDFIPVPLDRSNICCSGSTILHQARQNCSNQDSFSFSGKAPKAAIYNRYKCSKF